MSSARKRIPRRTRVARSLRPKPPPLIFPFVLLPAEIRNTIYQYALTVEGGIKVRWQRGPKRWQKKAVMLCDDGKHTYPVNQLQYVSRQLRKEAAGLEIQYNTVKFAAFPGEAESELKGLYVFAGRCTPRHLAWLTHVFVAPKCDLTVPLEKRLPTLWIRDHATEVIELLTFATTHPHIMIDFRIPYFSLEPKSSTFTIERFFRMGALLTALFDHKDISLFDEPGATGAIYDEHLMELLGQEVMDKIDKLTDELSMLRLHPKNTTMSDEEQKDFWRGVKWPSWSDDESKRIWKLYTLWWIKMGVKSEPDFESLEWARRVGLSK